GIGLGTVCGAPVAAAAIDAYGWRAAATGLGAIAGLFLAAIAFFIPKAPVMGSQRSPWRIADVVRNREFLLVYASGITTGLVLYVAVVFLAPYAIHHGIPNVQAAALVGGIGIASTASRLIFGGVGDRLGVIRTFKLGNALLVVSYAIWLASGSYWLLFAASLVLGAGYGALVALTPAVLMAYFGRERIGAVMGALYTSTSFGALAGTPIAGLIIGSNSNYQAAIWVFFVVAVFGAAVVTLLRPLTAAAGANAVARS
ncbi:MAG: MFS transporter, partial [Sulfurifustis sp.]